VENAGKEPDSPYGVAKLASELYVSYYARVHSLDAVTLRFANVYGPRQDPHGEAGVVAIFCGRIRREKPLIVFGDGEQTRDYVHVADVAEATYAAATRHLPATARLDERAFNVGTGVETSVRTLASTLLRVAGVTLPIEFAPRRQGEQRHSSLSIDRACTILEWRPGVPLPEGLAETYSWFSACAATDVHTRI
jgi:UDP-glucose 4-epimerase